jgi:hypothetical protein
MPLQITFEAACLYATLPLVALCFTADLVRQRVPDSAWPGLLERLKAWGLVKLGAIARRASRRKPPLPSAPRAKLGWPFQRERL